MAWRDDRTIGEPIVVNADGDDRTINSLNYGDAKNHPERTIPVIQNRDNRYDLDINQAQSFGKSTGQGYTTGGQVQIGILIEINGTPSNDLHIVFNLAYYYFLKSIFFTSASTEIWVGQMPENAPRFPDIDSSVLNEKVPVQDKVDNLESDAGKDRWINDGTDDQPLVLTQDSISDGDRYRLVMNLSTAATATLARGEAKADVHSGDGTTFGGNIDGYAILDSIRLSWR